MKVRCGKCKSSDIEAAYPPTRFEEKLAWVLPLSPYQCDKCERRFLSWASPLMDRNRSISSGIVVGLLSLGVILMAISEPDMPTSISPPKASAQVSTAQPPKETTATPQPVKPAVEPPAAQMDESSSKPADGQDKEPQGSAEGTSTAVTQPPAAARVNPPAATTGQPASSPQPADARYSSSVLDQLRKNQARDHGTPVEATPNSAKPSATANNPSPAPDKSPAPTSKPVAATTKPAEPPPSPQAKATAAESAKKTKEKPVAKPAAERARLDDLRIESKGDVLELHIVCSGSLLPEGRLLAKVYFVDLPGKWDLKRGLGDRKLDHPLTSGMRVGKHADFLRIAFDLKDKPVAASFKIEPSGLLLRLAPKE